MNSPLSYIKRNLRISSSLPPSMLNDQRQSSLSSEASSASPPQPMKRSASSLRFPLFSSSTPRSSHEEETLEETAEVLQLELALSNRNTCNNLVQELIQAGCTDSAFQIRFLGYYNDFCRTQDKHMKQTKGRKIIETFTQPNSPFRLDVMDSVKVSSVRDLPKLKHFLLMELNKLPIVKEVIALPPTMEDDL